MTPEKDFDAVKMMRDFRDKKHAEYEHDPEKRRKRLAEIRKKYAARFRKKEISKF
jgi:hypothetical protein